MSLAGRHVQLYGGPEDGATVYVPPGNLPERVGVARQPDGALVPIRSRQILADPAAAGHVQVYEHLTPAVFRGWCHALGRDDHTWARLPEDVPLYVWRELATRWLAAP